eukprot:3384118-Pyramimonas_sp.AAC.1
MGLQPRRAGQALDFFSAAPLAATGAFPDRAVGAVGAAPAGFPRACADSIGQHLRSSSDVPFLLPNDDG